MTFNNFFKILDTTISRTTLIKHRVKAHRNVLISEIEPTDFVSVLLKSKSFQLTGKNSFFVDNCCKEQVFETILSLVENERSDQFVEDFVTALKDLGYCDIVELIDPPDIHSKAGKYKAVTSYLWL